MRLPVTTVHEKSVISRRNHPKRVNFKATSPEKKKDCAISTRGNIPTEQYFDWHCLGKEATVFFTRRNYSKRARLTSIFHTNEQSALSSAIGTIPTVEHWPCIT